MTLYCSTFIFAVKGEGKVVPVFN